MTAIPFLTDLFTGVIASMQAQYDIVIPMTGKSFLRDLAGIWAAKLKDVYLYLGDVQKNAWYDQADPPSMGGTLYRFGFSFLKRYPREASQGQYNVNVTGMAGATVLTNTTFLSDPSSLSPNYLFILDADYVLTGSGDVMTLRAVTAGTVANLAVSDTLTCTKPLINVQQQVSVASVSVSAIDDETVEEYRAAIDVQRQLEPQGGAFADYRIWGNNVAGVRKIYPYTASGAVWEVDVYVEAILSDSGGAAPDYGYGVPTGTILTNVTDAILTDPVTGIGRKPAGVVLGPSNVGAIAVTVYQVTIAFTGSTGITLTQQSLIIAALQQAIANIRPFIAGCDAVANQNDTLSVSLPATGGRIAPPEDYVIVVIAMAAAPGALFTGVTMTVNGSPATSYTFDTGIIPYLKAANVSFS